jgi:hypothetical protein
MKSGVFTGTFMKTMLWVLLSAMALQVQAHETNLPPRTKLQGIEEHTNTVVVKGFTDIGSVDGTFGCVVVVAKESVDRSTRQKALGVALAIRGRERTQDVSLVDYDELESLLSALDSLNSPPWSDISMQQFEAVYTSKDGLRVATVSNKATGGMEAIVQSTHVVQSTAVLTTAQLNTLRTLISQAKGKLDAIHR